VRRRLDIADERGTTLVELMIGMAAGLVVLFALTMMILVTMNSTARVSARVDATRNARLTVTSITEQLRSSCVAPRIAPVRAGSTGTSLLFIHQRGSEVVLDPVLSKIELVNGTLTQYDYAKTSGAMPDWIFASSPTSKRQLATGIGPIAPSSAVFTYLGYSGKAINLALPAAPLSTADAARTVAVRVEFSASPRSGAGTDAGAAAQVRDTALLRLTSLAFSKESDEPCI
jgi:Tfp pilus assembly protein PilW